MLNFFQHSLLVNDFAGENKQVERHSSSIITNTRICNQLNWKQIDWFLSRLELISAELQLLRFTSHYLKTWSKPRIATRWSNSSPSWHWRSKSNACFWKERTNGHLTKVPKTQVIHLLNVLKRKGTIWHVTVSYWILGEMATRSPAPFSEYWGTITPYEDALGALPHRLLKPWGVGFPVFPLRACSAILAAHL